MVKSPLSLALSPFTLIRALPFVAGAILFTVGVYLVGPGLDFQYHYRLNVQAWLIEGYPLYSEGTRGFYNPPWTVFLLLPFVLLPERLGSVALALFSIGVIFWVTIYFSGEGRQRLLALGLVLSSLHTLYVPISGQIDAFPLLGVLLGSLALEKLRLEASSRGSNSGASLLKKEPWVLSLSFLLLATKPQAVILVIVLYLLSLKDLPSQARLAALSLPILAFVVSLPLFGMDWPLRWWQAYNAQPPHPELAVTTWRAVKELRLPFGVAFMAVATVLIGTAVVYLRLGPSKDMIGLAVLSSALATVFSSPSSSFLILAVSFPRLLAMRPSLALALYLLSLTPFLRLIYGLSVSWIDITFWWGLWLATFLNLWARTRPTGLPLATG